MITDNTPKIEREKLTSLSYTDQQWELLRKHFSHRTVSDLCKGGLLVFPHSLGNSKKEFCQQFVCEITDKHISTGNVVGFVGVKDKDSGQSAELAIRSRFQCKKESKEFSDDYFFHYMLQRVFNIHILNLPTGKTDDSVFDIALYLFPYYLKRAMKQGLFKQYRKCEYNDANVRGVIDVTRHIRHNIPFNGRIAYRTTEYKYDNALTQLIRHTIEYIAASGFAGNILKCDKDMRDYVRTIYDITPTYKANDRRKIISQNLKPVTHPFYTEYRALQQLCLQILRHKELKYGTSDDKIYGVLFDCAWLWEEYLATFLPKEYTHAVKGKNKGIKLFKAKYAHDRYPDFYSLEKGVVLDAKYKSIDNGVQRSDLYQLISYIHTLQSESKETRGAFVYPSAKSKSVWMELCGYGGWLGKISMQIPDDSQDFCEFSQSMQKAEKELLTKIGEIANNNQETDKETIVKEFEEDDE